MFSFPLIPWLGYAPAIVFLGGIAGLGLIFLMIVCVKNLKNKN